MPSPSPFDVLGLDPEDADDGEIQAAYRRRVKEAHPDQGGSVEEFQRVRAAYDAVADVAVADDRQEDGPWEDPDTGDVSTVDVEFLDYEVLADHGWGLTDDDLFATAASADLAAAANGTFQTSKDDTLLDGAEDAGYTWPYSCRGGACANCAVAICEGDLSMPVDHILPQDLLDRGFRLSCVGEPKTDDLGVVYNVKHVPDLEELLLPPGPFARQQDD